MDMHTVHHNEAQLTSLHWKKNAGLNILLLHIEFIVISSLNRLLIFPLPHLIMLNKAFDVYIYNIYMSDAIFFKYL